MLNITSKDNSSVKEFVKLGTNRSFRESTNKFVIEGTKLVLEAYHNNITITQLFVTDECLKKHLDSLQPLFDTLNCAIITEEIECKMSTQKSPQGILAICKLPNASLPLDSLNGKYILLCDLQDSGNVGTIIRTAEALGVDGVIATKSTCDFYSPKVLRASMGSLFRMPYAIVPDAFNAVQAIISQGITPYASVLDSDAVDVRKVGLTKNSILLIGNEGNGLSDELSSLSKKITIPMSGNAESLNAAIAASILMWEFTK